MNLKNLKIWDIGLIKWSSICFTLFVVSIWPTFTNWVTSIHWAWFLGLSLALATKPIITLFKK